MARDVILEWNAVMLQANANDHALAHPEEGGPVLTGRAFAIVSGAMYDAYNSIKHLGGAFMTTASRQGSQHRCRRCPGRARHAAGAVPLTEKPL